MAATQQMPAGGPQADALRRFQKIQRAVFDFSEECRTQLQEAGATFVDPTWVAAPTLEDGVDVIQNACAICPLDCNYRRLPRFAAIRPSGKVIFWGGEDVELP